MVGGGREVGQRHPAERRQGAEGVCVSREGSAGGREQCYYVCFDQARHGTGTEVPYSWGSSLVLVTGLGKSG